jgi:hypothetical protein
MSQRLWVQLNARRYGHSVCFAVIDGVEDGRNSGVVS